MIKMVNNEKGITLMTLIITIILLVIITGVLSMNAYSSMQLSNLTKLQNDIQSLNDRVASYYVKNGKLPIYNDYSLTKTELISIINDISYSDNNTYYILDLDELDNLSLNYGDAYKSNGTKNKDKYIINEETHIIYYLEGVIYEGREYHTVGADWFYKITCKYLINMIQ